MLEIIQTVCLVVIALSLMTIAAYLGEITRGLFKPSASTTPAMQQPFDYTEIDRKTMGGTGLARQNSDYPLGD